MKESTLIRGHSINEWILLLQPVALTAVLYVINPDYMGLLFLRQEPYLIDPILPVGWAALASVISLISVAQSTLKLARHRYADSKNKQRATRIGAALVILMAILVVLLAPAALQVMRSGFVA